MAYGKIKADAIIYDNSGSDVEVSTADITGKAGLASPTFTGTPAAPTASSGTNTTQIATTAFVATGLGTKLPLAGGTLTGGLTGTTATFAGGLTQIFSSGNQQWGGNGYDGTQGAYISKGGTFYVTPASGSEAFLAYNEGSSSPKVTIKGDGSASFSGAVTADSYKTPAQAVSALDINLSTGNYFKKSISTSSTVTFSNPPASGTVGSFTLELVLTGTGTAITWPNTVYWNADAGQTAPTLTDARTHLFMFVTTDGGTKYRGAVLSNYTG